MKNYLIYLWYKYVAAIFRLLPIDNQLVVVQNFYGKGYGDNPKYIVNKLIENNNSNIKIIWLVKKDFYKDIPSEVKQIKRGTLKELYYLSTAKIWIDNCRKHYGVVKRKKQYYIQTWHGGVAYKKCEKDVINKLDKNYIKSAINDSKMIDLFLCGSEKNYNLIRSAFWYDGKIAKYGTPRIDLFFNNQKYSTEKEKIVLYAPTFRDQRNVSVYNINYERIIKELEKNFNNSWKMIIKLHPNEKDIQDSINYTKKIINGNEYNDINTIIETCDLLISDYSSCIFDAMYAKKKVILYIPDAEEYLKNRGTYINIDDLPFPNAKNEDELLKIINTFNEEQYEKNVVNFLKKIGNYENGKASEKVVDDILKIINGENNENKKI